MPQLDLTVFATQIFWLFIVFTALYFLSSRFFLPKISSAINARNEKIDADLSDAKKFISDYSGMNDDVTKILEQARLESSEIVQNAKMKFDSIMEEKISKIDADISKNLAKQEDKLYRKKSSMIQNLNEVAGKLEDAIIQKITNNPSVKRKGKKV